MSGERLAPRNNGIRSRVARLVNHEGFDPQSYLADVRAEVPAYDDLQSAALAALEGARATRVLDLGVGTGETLRRLAMKYPRAELWGIDHDPAMLKHAARACPKARLGVGRLQGELPPGPFDVVVSVLAVHHLHALEKASLFERVGSVLRPDGHFVLADLVVPEDPRDVVTEVDGDIDVPSRIDEQLVWLAEAGFTARLAWRLFDLAVLVARR